jgi:NAD(P)-dependent dehydrogenase (short-subunit alcohol dehydrogenase family)
MGLQRKTALVTGASRGIGRAVALRLASLGASVIVHYSASRDGAEAVAREIEHRGGSAVPLGADLMQLSGVDALIAGLGERRLDILVNNAGVSHRQPFRDVTAEEFERTVALDLRAPFFLIQKSLDRINDGGRIVNVSSMVTRAAFPELAAYAVAKGGLEALTLTLAPLLGERGITINAIRPGATLTEMNARLADPAVAEEVARTVALRRIGLPEDIAEVVAFLAGEGGRWVTGACIDASGGQRL